MHTFLSFDRILSVFHPKHLINLRLESRILADRQFIRQILGECMLFAKHCFIERKCEDSQGAECIIYRIIRLSYENHSPLITSIKTTITTKPEAIKRKRPHLPIGKPTPLQYTHIVPLFIISSPLKYTDFRKDQPLVLSSGFWIFSLLPSQGHNFNGKFFFLH